MFKVVLFVMLCFNFSRAFSASSLNDPVESDYDICADLAVSPKLSNQSSLPVRKRLIIVNPCLLYTSPSPRD